MEPVTHLDKKTTNELVNLTEEISILCTENLVSIYLYGSAAGRHFDPNISNLNTFILLHKIGIEELKGVARIYKKRARLGFVAPLVLTTAYINSSTDVFPIEILDIKENSILLTGRDVLKDVAIDLSCLRGQCEREIKGQLVRFRGSFLEIEGDQKGMERLVTNAISGLIFPLKNILRLTGQKIPEGKDTVIIECCKILGVSDKPFLDALAIKKGEGKATLEGIYTIISDYMDALEEMSEKIDSMISEGRL